MDVSLLPGTERHRFARLQVDTSRGRFRLERNGTLVIVGVRRDDGGLYRCRADNRLAAADTRTVTLTVIGELSRHRVAVPCFGSPR